MKRRSEMTFFEGLYVREVGLGILLTTKKFVRNLFLHLFGVQKQIGTTPATIHYPNEQRKYPQRFRGRHRLTLKSNGDVRCTACYLCATACPAKCIYIEACEHDDPSIEKFPRRYEIDTLLCIYCGYCVEACPVDAIRMDTGIHPEVYPPDPRMFIEDKETLMQRSRTLEDMGPQALFEEHMKKMQEIEKHPFKNIPK